jgi:di/tricarboxylate transporter
MVTQSSRLIGKKAVDIQFPETYKAAIIAYQKDGKNASVDASFSAGDILVLETYEGCPLVTKPPKDFYKKLDHDSKRSLDIEAEGLNHSVWKDLKVVFEDLQASQQGFTKGEFLTAFVITPGSPLKNKSVTELGFSKLPGAVLVQIERPTNDSAFKSDSKRATAIALSVDDVLAVGDLLWISGSAQAIGDLKKVNGLVLYEEATIKKTTKYLQDRRLVQAVIARGSPLVGYTVKEARFRSVYDGAVIAVQRGSNRIHDLPSTIKLQTGDVLLVEAGPSFMEKHGNNYKTFALLSEVENSSPPRPRLFLLLVVLFVVSLTVSALGYTSLLVASTITGMIMVATGVVTQQEARDCIQWDLYVVVAAAFGVGNAMKNSGVAEGLATFLVEIGKWLNIGGKSLIVATNRWYMKRIVCLTSAFSFLRCRHLWSCLCCRQSFE